MDKGDLKKRAKAIADGDWASTAVRMSVEAAYTSYSAAVAAAGGAAAASAGS